MYFKYDDKAVAYLKKNDKELGEAIDQIGHIDREITPDLFTNLVFTIIGQQISMKAQETICKRFSQIISEISAENVAKLSLETIQKCGISRQKARYIHSLSTSINRGDISLDELADMNDEQVVSKLISIPGIGRWTAEMMMIFSMQRMNVFSYDDLAVQRGLRMLHHHRKISKELFEKYRRRYTPYGSVACLYLWEIAKGELPGMVDLQKKNIKR